MQPMKKIMKTSPVPKKEPVIDIDLNSGDISRKAFELNNEHRSYDDYIWMLAESETKLSKAILTDMKSHSRTISVNASQIVDKPIEKDVRTRAAEIASARPKVQDLHWLIAERQYILDTARSRK